MQTILVIQELLLKRPGLGVRVVRHPGDHLAAVALDFGHRDSESFGDSEYFETDFGLGRQPGRNDSPVVQRKQKQMRRKRNSFLENSNL
jgi:hypothetical protein